MGQILRGITERFDPQVHTEEKSLTVNMNKYMEVKKKAIDLFSHQNRFISFLYATKRVNMGANSQKVMKARGSISDNAYRVQYEGSLFVPAYAFGKTVFADNAAEVKAFTDLTGQALAVNYGTGVTTIADIKHNVYVAIGVEHDVANNVHGQKFHEGDVISMGGYKGINIIVMGTPVLSTSSDHYIVCGKVNSPVGLMNESHFAAAELLSEAGTRFGEGSMKGYQRERRSKWKINYSFISRATLTMTGSAMSQQVQWLNNSLSEGTGQGMWEYKQVLDLHERHAMNLELGARYARTSMSASSHEWFEDYGTNQLTLDGFTTDYGIVAPVIGDGWIPQLDDAFSLGYDPNAPLPLDKLQMFMTILSQRSPSGTTGNTYIGLGDTLAHMNIDTTLKAAMGWTVDSTATLYGNSRVVWDVNGKKVELGFEVHTYKYLNNTFIFIEDSLMNHPAFNAQNGGIVGDGTIYVFNASLVDGVSNIDLLARRNRSLRAKYIDGLHSLDPNRNNVPYAASGFDGGRYDLLSEILPIIYSVESCGILRPTAKFLGGALSAESIATERAKEWHY